MQRELTQKAAEGLFYRKFNRYNPSVTLTRATSLYTREALFYLPEGNWINFTKHIYKPPKLWYNNNVTQTEYSVLGVFSALGILYPFLSIPKFKVLAKTQAPLI